MAPSCSNTPSVSNHVATIARHGGSGEHVALFEVGQGQRVAVKLSGLPVKGAPNVDGTPVIEVGHEPCSERGTDGLKEGITGRGSAS